MKAFLIADDLTGANDSLVRFANVGIRAVTLLNINYCQAALSYSAMAFDLSTRGLTSETAYRITREAAEGLPLNTGDIVYKKMDSALRGNVGPEIAAILDGLADGRTALVAPALPENGRITRNGYQLADGIPIHQTEMASDPVTPVTESHLPTLLTSGSRHRVGYLSLNTVMNGVEAITAELERLLADGCRIVVADAADVRNLDALAKICIDFSSKVLPCGSAGLAGALARTWGRSVIKEPFTSEVIERPGRIVAALIGSKSRNAWRQMEEAVMVRRKLAEIVVSRTALNSLSSRMTAIEQAVRDGIQAISMGKDSLMVRFDRNQEVDAAALDAAELAAGLGKIGRRLVETLPVKALYLSGGDIAVSTVKELGGWGIEIAHEAEPGICIGRIWRGDFEGLNIITKAGSFGDEGTLARIFSDWVN